MVDPIASKRVGASRQVTRRALKVAPQASAQSREVKAPELTLKDSVKLSSSESSSGAEPVSKPRPVYELTPKDLEEFRRYAPILVIDERERYAPVKMNFDGDWNLVNNAPNFDELKKRYTREELFRRYAVAYVNKLEDVEVDGERYTVYQYWFYWPFNDLPLDWHDHDLEYVQVYVDRQGKVRKVYTSYHLWHKIVRFAKEFLTSESPEKALMREKMPPFPVKENVVITPGGAHSEGDSPKPVFLVDGTHPLVIVEPNTHGMVFTPRESFILALLGHSPALIFTPQRFIPMISRQDPDAPFPGGEDVRGLTDEKGKLKHRGFPYNWFIRVRSPILRRSFWEGAHAVNSSAE